jgi:Ca2+-binding RTX toxin-like protein
VSADTLAGGEGNDRLIGGQGSSLIVFKGSADNDLLDGGNGTDTADYSTNVGRVVVALGLGTADGQTTEFVPSPSLPIQTAGSHDTLRSIENIVGSAFGDVITGNERNNALSGGDGNDTITGGAGADTMNGGNDSDRFDIKVGSDVVAGEVFQGGDGVDFLALQGAGAVDFEQAIFSDIETLTFFSGTSIAVFSGNQIGTSAIGIVDGNAASLDTLVVNGASIDLTGVIFSDWAGDDVISLNGTLGDDTITGSTQNDLLSGGDQADSMSGGLGNDTLAGGVGADTLDGGDDIDTASYVGETNTVSVTLAGAIAATVSVGGAAEDTIVNIENVIGGEAGDTITGDNLANHLSGGGGSDTLNGGTLGDVLDGESGSDLLLGANGIDTLTGGLGDDTVKGGGGNDSYIYALGDGIDRVNDSGGAADRLIVGSFADITQSVRVGNNLVLTFTDGGQVTVANHFLDANRVENVVDALGQVVILAAGTIGGDAGGILSGTGGADYLNGNGGDDFLFGGDGHDLLDGGEGDDLLRGGGGNDDLLGGAGHDTFVLAAGDGEDTLYDFDRLLDTIALDRASFGFDESTSVGDVVKIGGAAPSSGAKIYITGGSIVFDSDWSTSGDGEVLAMITGTNPHLSDLIFI